MPLTMDEFFNRKRDDMAKKDAGYNTNEKITPDDKGGPKGGDGEKTVKDDCGWADSRLRGERTVRSLNRSQVSDCFLD